ncbi:hypothetical protein ACQ4PT_015983 [Festuca glaucescens]
MAAAPPGSATKTTALKNGSFGQDIHYWLGKDTSQDEAGTAAIKTVELDAALGGRGVQYREVQGNETEKFLSYFKPCIIPEEGGVASGFRHAEVNAREHVPFARSSLNHEDIFILDTESKIFQFNGSNSSIQERAKALEVVQYLKDTNHEGKCDVAAVEDGKLMADADAGEFWGLFGGFAPLPRKTFPELNGIDTAFPPKLLCVNKVQTVSVDCDVLTKALLDSTKCYILDCGSEIYVWMGRETALEDRKRAGLAAEELLREGNRPKSHIIRLMEGSEMAIFRSKFNKWPKKAEAVVSDESRGKVTGFNAKGITKAAPVKEEPLPQIDCTGNLQVRLYEGKEPIEFFPIFQNLVIFKGGASTGYKKFVSENGIQDDTYSENGVGLFRVQGSGPDNMQAIQVDTVREIFNFAQDDMMTEDIFILDCHSCVFVWVGQHVDTKIRAQALSIGEKFLELDILMENLARETPLYVINEGSEPQYFTRFFTWDSAKSAMRGNSFERRLSVLKDGVKPRRDKPKRRPITSSHTGRSSVPDKSQRRSTSFSPDRVRVRGRSPAFNALAANFENSNARNLSTPPPVARKSFSKSSSPDPIKPPQRAASIAAMSASFERPKQTLIPKSIKGKPKPEVNAKESTTPAAKDGQTTVTPTIHEDVKEGQPEDDEGLPVYPYDRLRTSSTNPATDIDQSRRETYLSSAEFREKFGMAKEAFAKLPKWKQNRLKIALQLF